MFESYCCRKVAYQAIPWNSYFWITLTPEKFVTINSEISWIGVQFTKLNDAKSEPIRKKILPLIFFDFWSSLQGFFCYKENYEKLILNCPRMVSKDKTMKI